MGGYRVDIDHATERNTFFRQVLFTGPNAQLVVMAIRPGEDIGLETHKTIDQFIRVEEGEGIALIGDKTYRLEEDVAIIIPAGNQHNITNTSGTEILKLYTVYTQKAHPAGTVHRTKPSKVHT